ncbi:MAG: hypothetical protein D6712_05970 [Chloroflexi bacterium]|nr:MAG: hypothetical protein D6712_05970 [Chloroflexota bacterium]
MATLIGALGILGPLAVGGLLVILGLLSRRMARVTHDKPYYILSFIGALLVWSGAVIRLLNLNSQTTDLHQNLLWSILYNGLPAAGLTLGLYVGWRYWSWLLADRE